MNELVKTEKQQYVARYEDGDPYANFANEGGPGIQGKLLTCKKGEWQIGADGDLVPAGALYLLVVPTMMRGVLKWQDRVVVDARMGFVKDGFLIPHPYSLPDRDESTWEKGPDGPRDPWSRCYRVVLIELAPPHGEMTFSGGSYGTEIALKAICGTYSAEQPGADLYPVVELSTKPRMSRNYGKQIGPWFEVKGWASIEDVRAGRKAGAAKAKAKPKPKPKAKPAVTDDEPAPWSHPDA